MLSSSFSESPKEQALMSNYNKENFISASRSSQANVNTPVFSAVNGYFTPNVTHSDLKEFCLSADESPMSNYYIQQRVVPQQQSLLQPQQSLLQPQVPFQNHANLINTNYVLNGVQTVTQTNYHHQAVNGLQVVNNSLVGNPKVASAPTARTKPTQSRNAVHHAQQVNQMVNGISRVAPAASTTYTTIDLAPPARVSAKSNRVTNQDRAVNRAANQDRAVNRIANQGHAVNRVTNQDSATNAASLNNHMGNTTYTTQRKAEQKVLTSLNGMFRESAFNKHGTSSLDGAVRALSSDKSVNNSNYGKRESSKSIQPTTSHTQYTYSKKQSSIDKEKKQSSIESKDKAIKTNSFYSNRDSNKKSNTERTVSHVLDSSSSVLKGHSSSPNVISAAYRQPASSDALYPGNVVRARYIDGKLYRGEIVQVGRFFSFNQLFNYNRY